MIPMIGRIVGTTELEIIFPGEKNSIYKINNITTYILSYLMEKNISRNRYIHSSLYNKEGR